MDLNVTEDDEIKPHLFSWCSIENRHDKCRREFRKFSLDAKTNKIIWENIVYRCSCVKRGCKCYTRPADRPKAAKKTRRKK